MLGSFIKALHMVYELIVFGGVAFWLLTALAFLIILMTVDSVDYFSFAFTVFVGYIAVFALFSDVNLDLGKYWWGPILYLLIGLGWFLFMMTYRVRSLRRWMDSQEDPDAVRESLKGGDGPYIPHQWRSIYNTEPSWPKFIDRVTLWPLSMLKFASRDLIEVVYNMCAARLVAYRDALLGIKP